MKPAAEADNNLAAWIEWKERCALGLCGETTRAALQAFGAARFRTYVKRYAAATGADDAWRFAQAFPPADAWHLFESHVQTQHTSGGKRYKDWLFARSGSSANGMLDTIQGGATLIMRNVVAQHIRRECAARGTISLEELGVDGITAMQPAEVLLSMPDPADETALREYEGLAQKHAAEAFEEMSHRERVALLSREIGLPLSDPAVTQAANCRKSALHTSYHTFFKRMAMLIRAMYPEDDLDAVLSLTLMLIRAITERVNAWAYTDDRCRALLPIERQL